MRQDRFLIGILIFIALLVIAALVLFFVRQDVQTYGPEDTPEGVIRNYAIALQKRDFERAYTYLADKENKPEFDAFRRTFITHQLDVTGTALKIGSVEYTSDDEAMVQVSVIYAASGPFAESRGSSEYATLVRQNGEWRLIYMPYPYWAWDWYQPPVEPVRP